MSFPGVDGTNNVQYIWFGVLLDKKRQYIYSYSYVVLAKLMPMTCVLLYSLVLDFICVLFSICVLLCSLVFNLCSLLCICVHSSFTQSKPKHKFNEYKRRHFFESLNIL